MSDSREGHGEQGRVRRHHSADEFLSEEEAHRVLARAVELDTRAVSDVSVAQLQSIAAEAGIAPDALECAMREFRAGELPGHSRAASAPRPRLSAQLRRFRRHAALASIVAAAAATPGDFLVLSVLTSMPIYALYEICIYLVHKHERGGPSSPVSTNRPDVSNTVITTAKEADCGTRKLSLRPFGLSPVM
jgi:hypothetical protein